MTDPEEREARLEAAEALRGLARNMDTMAAQFASMTEKMEMHGHLMPLSVELRTPERLRQLYSDVLSVADDLRRIAEEITEARAD